MTVFSYDENTQGHTSQSNYPTLSENSTFTGYDNQNQGQSSSYFIIPVNYNDTVNFTISGPTSGDILISYTFATAAWLQANSNALFGDIPWQEANSGTSPNLGALSAATSLQQGFLTVSGPNQTSGSGYLIIEVDENSAGTENYVLNMSNPSLPPPPPTDSFITVGLTGNNVTTLLGSVADSGGPGINTVNVYNGTTLLGTATVNNGTWTLTLQTPLAEGTSHLNVVATDIFGTKTTANSPISLVTNSTGAITAATFNQGSTGTLDVNGTTMPTTVINGFAPGDIIDLTSVPFDDTFGYSFADPISRQADNVLQIVENGNTYALHLSADFSGGGVELSDDGSGGTSIKLSNNFRVIQIKNDIGSKGYSFNTALAYIYKQAARANPTLNPFGTPIGFSGAALNKIIEERAMWDEVTNSDPILVQVDHYLQEVESIETYPNAVNLGVQIFAPLAYDGLKLVSDGLASSGNPPLMNVAQWVQGAINTSQYPATDPSLSALEAAYNGLIQGVTTSWQTAAQEAYTGLDSLDPTFTVYDLQTSSNDQTVTADNVNFYNVISGPNLPALTGNEIIVDNLVSNNPLAVDHGNNLVIEYVGNKTVVLGDGDNFVFLVRGNNVVEAGSGTNVMFAGAGNDTFIAGSAGTATTGNTFDGGAGWNDAVFGIASTSATVTRNTDGTTTVSYSGGTDTFNNVEVVKFTDESIALRTRAASDFLGSNTSDILFRNTSTGDTWFEAMSNGAFAGWNQIGSSSTSYAAAGIGDFLGNGAQDILFRNNSTGDTWFEAVSNGVFASWQQIGGSNTAYSIVGVADFYGSGTDDILFRNNSNGDTWIEAISNGAVAGWNPVGGSDTHYSAVGLGDFLGNGTDDILFRNNSTGDTWIEAISNGAYAGWHLIGGSDTHYSVVGVGDFFGNGTDDILFRNNSSGDTWIEAISNGASAGWNPLGGSNTAYAVAAVGDYFGNGTDDILFRNNSSGDTWFEAISSGASAGWHQVGGSSTSYTVKT
jgi:hypothetical protein